MESYNERMKDFWKRYEERIDKENGEYLIIDGVNPDWYDTYKSQDPKVLFILTGGSAPDSSEVERMNIFHKDGWFGSYAKGDKSDGNAITMMLAMNYALKNIDKVTADDMKANKENIDAAEEIKKIAFMHVNKHGSSNLSVEESYLKYLEEDADLLAEQIDIIQPDIIVLGNRDASQIFNKNVLGKLSINIPRLIETEPFSLGFSYEEFLDEAKRVLGN